jgi:DNA-damage-inducible protein D
MADELEVVVTHLESKKKLTAKNVEIWRARDLMPLLGYAKWDNFREIIQKAVDSCQKSEMAVENHFRETKVMVSIGSGAKREVEDWVLTRHACNLIAMNGDVSKPVIAAAQAYFSVQTHKQEALAKQTDEQRRLILRNRVKDGNLKLGEAAASAGVQKFGVFHDAGYKGLYGMGKPAVQKKKGISEEEDLLDCIGPTELAANEFRVTQTEDKLRREKVIGEEKAIAMHLDVGAKVRETIKELGGTMPEDLPAEPSIRKLAAKHARDIKKLTGGNQ